MHEYKHFIDPTVMQDSHPLYEEVFRGRFRSSGNYTKLNIYPYVSGKNVLFFWNPAKCKHRRLCNEQAVHRFYPDFIPYVRQLFLK